MSSSKVVRLAAEWLGRRPMNPTSSLSPYRITLSPSCDSQAARSLKRTSTCNLNRPWCPCCEIVSFSGTGIVGDMFLSSQEQVQISAIRGPIAEIAVQQCTVTKTSSSHPGPARDTVTLALRHSRQILHPSCDPARVQAANSAPSALLQAMQVPRCITRAGHGNIQPRNCSEKASVDTVGLSRVP